MGLLKKVIYNVVVYTLICVFSSMYIFGFLYEAWRRRNKPSSYKDCDTEPACLSDPKYGKHDFLTLKDHDNLRIHYVANGSKDKPLMLFLHGFPEFWYVWKYQLPEFGKDYYAVAIDMIGYGKSDKPKAVDKYSSIELSKHVKEVVKELGYDSCVLVGHDWGGSVSYTVAAEYPEVVDQLIVLNCPHGAAMKKTVMSGGIKQLLASSYMFFFQLPYLPEYFLSAGDITCLDLLREGEAPPIKNLGNFTVEDLEAYKYSFFKGGFTGPLNYYRNVFFTKKVNRKSSRIIMPTLIIWGTGDLALTVELAELSLKYIEHGTVKYIDDAAHFVNLDEPAKVNRYMKEFLNNQ